MKTKQLKKVELFDTYLKYKYVKFGEMKIQNIEFDDLNGIVYFKSSIRKNFKEIESLQYLQFLEYLFILNTLDEMQPFEILNKDYIKQIIIENNEMSLEITKHKVKYVNHFFKNNNIYDTIDSLIETLEDIKNKK